MIGYIKGTVEQIADSGFILESNNMGFEINAPMSTISSLVTNDEVKIYTYMSVKEDDISLFGFLTRGELDMFKMLITVSGIGPKGALGILSSMNVDELRMAIAAEDSKLIAKAKGIGAKTAQKIVVELKGKVDKDIFVQTITGTSTLGAALANSVTSEAIDVLEALGFSRAESVKAISQLESTDNMTSSEIVAAALKVID